MLRAASQIGVGGGLLVLGQTISTSFSRSGENELVAFAMLHGANEERVRL